MHLMGSAIDESANKALRADSLKLAGELNVIQLKMNIAVEENECQK